MSKQSEKIIIHITLIVILSIGFYLRLAHLTEVQLSMPKTAILCGGDGETYDTQAQAALAGTWPNGSIFESVPLYPFYLTVVYQIWGVNYVAPLIIQILLELVACAALYWIGKYVYSSLAGLLTALAAAIYGPLIVYEPCYAPVVLTVPLLVFMFYFLFRYYKSDRFFFLVISGVMLGLCALSRPTMLIITPVICLWFFTEKKSWGQFIHKSIWFTIAVGLVILPLTLHNYQVSGDFIPISQQGANNLYFGNNPYTSGIGPHGITDQYGQRVRGDITFATEYEHIRTQVEHGETTFTKQIVSYITQQPQDWLELTVKKMYLMFLEPDWKLILTSFIYPISSAALKNSPFLQFFPTEWIALEIMSLLCLIFVRNRATILFWLVSLAVSVVIIIFFVKFRFRLPLVPLFLLMSFGLIAQGRNWFYKNRRKYTQVLLILLVLLPFVPSLLLFCILYVIVALVPFRRKISLGQFRWQLLVGWSYVVLVFWGWQLINTHKANTQTQNYYTGPEIWGTVLVGQTFSPDCDGLYRIDVELSRESFTHNQPYWFHLIQGANISQPEIYQTAFDVNHVTNWTTKTFTFPPQPNSAGHTYLFYIHSPTAHPGNTVTVRLYPDLPTVYKRYKKGTIIAGTTDNLQSIPADLSFAAYCQESIWQLFTRTMRQMSEAGPTNLAHPELYLGIFFLHLGLLVLALVKTIKIYHNNP